MKWAWAGMGVKIISDGKFIRFEKYGFQKEEMQMNIRAKHGPHIVVFVVPSSDKLINALIYARETLNATYGLKLENEKGITLEVL